MFGLDLLFLGALAISSINLYPHDIELKPGLDVSTEFSAHREWWRGDGEGKCVYTGLVVPYARDWNDVDEFNNIVRPAEPDVPVAQAILVNKKVCDGKPDEIILRAGETWGTKGILRPGNIINVVDMTEAREDQRPKWYLQVMTRVERLASTDAKVKDFVETLRTLKAATSEPAPDATLAAPTDASTGKPHTAQPAKTVLGQSMVETVKD